MEAEERNQGKKSQGIPVIMSKLNEIFSLLIEKFLWAKLAYTLILLSIILLFSSELVNLWLDKKIYIRNFQFFDAGKENEAKGKSLALQAISQHRKLVHLLALENKQRTKSTNQENRKSRNINNQIQNTPSKQNRENTWWPQEVSPINNPESALSEIELTVQNINFTDILTRIRQWISKPNEISAILDKNKNVVDATVKWSKGPSQAKGQLVDGQFLYIGGKTDESSAIFHIACSLIWAQAASQQENLSKIPHQHFCNWAEAWMNYIVLRNKSQSITGLNSQDIDNIKQLRKFLTQQLNQGNSYPEIYRLRADIIDLLPNDQRTEEDLSQAQQDRTLYAVLIDTSGQELSSENLEYLTLAKARPAIPVEQGVLSKDISETWNSVLFPYQEQIAKAAKATGFGYIKQKDQHVQSYFVGFAVAPNIIATVDFNLDQSFTKDTDYPKVLDDELIGIFSFDDQGLKENPEQSLQIKEILFASNYPNEKLSFALLKISGHNPNDNPPLLVEKTRSSVPYFIDRFAFVVGYPSEDFRIPKFFLDELLKNRRGIKRIMPGRILSLDPSSLNSNVRQITSDMSTAPGTSGGPLVDLQTGRVLGIHYGGQWIQNPESQGKFAYAEVFADILKLPNLTDEVRKIFNEE